MKTSIFLSGVVLLIFYITVISCARAINCNCEFRCDYKLFKEINGFLKYHEIPSNWKDARLRCHLEGAKLASPLDPNMMKAMQELIKCRTIYTGIHSTFSKGDYISIEGVPLAEISHTWDEGEPDNYEDHEGCIVMRVNGTFADRKCSEVYPYLCYKKLTECKIMTECGTTDQSYTLDKTIGSCYKFHQNPRTWYRAFMTCVAEGGYLAIINSEAESKALGQLFSKMGVRIPNIGVYESICASIGFHDWGEHGEWVTIHGDNLIDAGFDKFQPGEPNNASAQFCGGIYRSGLLDDYWCDRRAQFICEKDPQVPSCPDEQ